MDCCTVCLRNANARDVDIGLLSSNLNIREQTPDNLKLPETVTAEPVPLSQSVSSLNHANLGPETPGVSEITETENFNPRMTKLLSQLKSSIERFEHVYNSHLEASSSNLSQNTALGEMLQDAMAGEGLMATAGLLETKMNYIADKDAKRSEGSISKQSSSLYIAKVLPLVKLVMDVGGLAAQAAGCIPATVALRGTYLLLEMCAAARGLPNDVLKTLDSISYQTSRLVGLKTSALTEGLKERSTALLTSILNYYSVCLSMVDTPPLASILKALFKTPQTEYDLVSRELQTAIRHFDQAIGDQTRGLMLEAFKANNDQGFFEWLSPSHWEVTGRLFENIGRRLAGTLLWVQDMAEIHHWLSGETPNVLCFTGLPGVGKSVIAAHLIESIYVSISNQTLSQIFSANPSKYDPERQGKPYLAYFFCKRGEQKLMHAANIIQTFSYQLARQNTTFMDALHESRVSEQFTVSSGMGVRLLYNRLFERPLAYMTKSGAKKLKILCVIDGLDEASFENDGFTGMPAMHILLQLLSMSNGVRLLVVTRAIPEVLQTLETLPSITKEIDSTQNSADIGCYVQWKVSLSQKLDTGFRQLQINPSSHFKHSAQGNFLWTEITLRYLETSTSFLDFRSGLHEIPVQFFDLYKQVMRRIIETVNARTRGTIKYVLAFTVAAPRELEVKELQELVQEATGDAFFDFSYLIKSVCGTFLQIVGSAADPRLRFVRIVHETFRDFITSPVNSNEEFHVSMDKVHGEILILLLKALGRSKLLGQLIPGRNVEVRDEDSGDILKKTPLLKYAATHWSYHLGCAPTDSRWTHKLQVEIGDFLLQGSLLTWIEALAVFDITALARVRMDLYSWKTRTKDRLSSDFVGLLDSFDRDLARVGHEYSKALAQCPNSVHSLFFDLFPEPSLLQKRYGRQRLLFSGERSNPLHPAIVGVSNIFDHDYELVAFSDGPPNLIALSSFRHIRIVGHSFGETIGIVSPHLSESWAVLSLAFTPARAQKNLLAAVYVSSTDSESMYQPILSIWDVDTLGLVAETSMSHPNNATIPLVDWLEFSDCSTLKCGIWKFTLFGNALIEEGRASSEIGSEAMTMSRNGQYMLLLDPGDHRTLRAVNGPNSITFDKPPYYHYSDDIAANVEADDVGHQRWLVAPSRWWQLWREVTRAYQFSPDSRLFARFTKEHGVVVCDLNTFSEIVVHTPCSSWTRILMNNLAFDSSSERLVWTFNHDIACDTRVYLWDKKSRASHGFYLGRCGWMERVDFCLDSRYVLTYRAAITIWDVPLAFKITELHENRRGSEDWRIELENWYSSDYSIQLHYSSRKLLFAHIREEIPRGGCTVQVFDWDRRIAAKFSFRSRSDIQTAKWGPQWTTDGETYATEDVIFDISETGMIRECKRIRIHSPLKILAAVTHFNRGLMACVQPGSERGFELQLHEYSDRETLTTIEFGAELSGEDPPDTLLLIDPAEVPTFVFVLTAQHGAVLDSRIADSDSAGELAPQWSVSVFELRPSLTLQTTFPIAASPAIRTPYTRLTGLFANDGMTVVCIQESKHSASCALWLINVRSRMWNMQYFSNCWLLTYVPSKGIIVALATDGWLQCKPVSDMNADVIKYGKEEQKFDGRNDPWIWTGWKKLLYLPPSYLPCYESNLAVHEDGELAYVDEYGKRLIQINFEW